MTFAKYGIVPDFFDVEPPALLEVTYPNDLVVNGGNILTPTQVRDEPVVRWEADSNAYYLLSMIDPLPPSEQFPKCREFIHWLVGNIPGNDLSKGEVLTEYVGGGPPQGTGLHRYTFVLYKQPGKLNFTEGKVVKTMYSGRISLSSRDFAKKYNLGEPVAGNLFRAEWDEYVPYVHEQIGFKI